MVKNEARKKAVRDMGKLAQECDVQRAHEDAGRKKVTEMVEAVRASSTSALNKAKLERLFAKYEKTFASAPEQSSSQQTGSTVSAAPAPAATVGPEQHPQRLRGTSFLNSYNWDFFGKAFPDGTPPAKDHADLWRLWLCWKKSLKKELRISKSTHTMEESLESSLSGRVHFHWKINLKAPLNKPTNTVFAFHGIKPDTRKTFGVAIADKKGARGVSFEEASNRAHFYCWANKKGSLFRGSNWQPFRDYRVNGRWLEDLWGDHKLSHEEYKALSLQVRRGHAQRMRDFQAVVGDEHAAEITRHIHEANLALATLKAPFCEFDAVKAWEDSFLTLAFRWQILVLCADSASGKSNYAESLFTNPFCLTVEESEHLDLKDFDRSQHDGVVLDNVNSWGQLLAWRAVLQARNAKFKGGTSSTNMYAWTKWLYGVPFVATIDLDAPDAYLVDDQSQWRSRWLLKNTVRVSLSAGETFYDRAKVPTRKVDNNFSLFVNTLKRRRAARTAVP